jgi:hypothetical protein
MTGSGTGVHRGGGSTGKGSPSGTVFPGGAGSDDVGAVTGIGVTGGLTITAEPPCGSAPAMIAAGIPETGAHDHRAPVISRAIIRATEAGQRRRSPLASLPCHDSRIAFVVCRTRVVKLAALWGRIGKGVRQMRRIRGGPGDADLPVLPIRNTLKCVVLRAPAAHRGGPLDHFG